MAHQIAAVHEKLDEMYNSDSNTNAVDDDGKIIPEFRY
jgi:hypothetical protein